MSIPTIYDVSQLANVSIATVSRVLNTPDRVSAQTRARVISAIDALNFVPKSEAVARARKRFGRIGILTSTATYDSFVDRLRGLFDALAGLSFEPIIFDVTTTAQRDSYLTSLPSGRQIDGLLIIDIPIDERAQQRLLKHKLPTVQIVASDQLLTNNQLTTIVHNDRKGGRIAAQYLLDQGHQTIAYIGDSGASGGAVDFGDQQLDSFRQTLALNSIALPGKLVRTGHFSMESAYKAMHALIDLPQRPTAVFASNDTLAIGALKAVRERGLRVPDDIAVMGYDNIAIAEFIGLTTVDQQLKASGKLAIELLIKQMQNKQEQIQTVELPFTLIQRDTA